MSEYQVLARKYRPKKLSELIGQDVLARTLSSAISQNRIPHAFVLTGIRGVGKTSTARIIARSLLCTATENPTTEPCGVCANCEAINKDNHVDLIEVDAASRTGVNDIREIIDQVVYAPVMGRFKIYIIDEVHMLSKSAFNALLKTLEEPPPHVKFIFATTEIRKIPVTILSRCMRFDLPRVSVKELSSHFKNVAAKESVKIDDNAVKIIANAAEGSVRDGLSLLDQAIAVSVGEDITAEKLSAMLGLADRDQIYSLLKQMLDGEYDAALKNLSDLYAKGNDPLLLIKDLLEITHSLTLAKASPEILTQDSIPEMEKVKLNSIIAEADLGQLTRMWQIINKALEESRYCPTPLMAAEMLVVRACYASKLPSPEELLNRLEGNDDSGQKDFLSEPTANLFAEKKTPESSIERPVAPASTVANPSYASAPVISAPASNPASATASLNNSSQATTPSAPKQPATMGLGTSASTAPVLKPIINENPVISGRQEILDLSVPEDFKALVKLFTDKKENFRASELEDLKLVDYNAETGVIQFLSQPNQPQIDVRDITKKLFDWTGKRFTIVFENLENSEAVSINDERKAALEKRKNDAINSPVVQTILKEFEGAKVASANVVIEN